MAPEKQYSHDLHIFQLPSFIVLIHTLCLIPLIVNGLRLRLLQDINLFKLAYIPFYSIYTIMIKRSMLNIAHEALSRQAAVVLLGPRQVGKTTLAWEIAKNHPGSIYLDLENERDRQKLQDAASFLGANEDSLIVIDEIHRIPSLFPTLRGLIDQGRRRGIRTGRFLLLGSASIELLKQSGESLAGRVSYLELGPFNIGETDHVDRLWIRGGFPDSYLASDDNQSIAWREDMIRTYLERDIPMLGPRIPAETLRRFWTMLAHTQGGLLNAARLASSLEVSGQSIARYCDLLVDLLLVRRLQPYLANVGKRLIKSPKVYIRDSGLVHALLNMATYNEILGHPVCGASWEGFAIENIIGAAPPRTISGFYRTSAGAEIDLILEFPGGKRWAIEIKRGETTSPSRGFYEACRDLKPERAWMVHAGKGQYALRHDIQSIGLKTFVEQLGHT